MAEHLFDVVTGAHADVFQARGAVANDDFLLRRALDKDRAIDTHEILAHLFPLFSYHGGHVRNLFARLFKNFLAYNFRGQYADGLVRKIVFREEWLAFRQMPHHLSQQLFDLVALQCRNRHHRFPFMLAVVPLDQRQQLRLVLDPVGLVKQEKGRLFGLLDQVEHEAIAVAGRRRRVANQTNQIDAQQRIVHRGHHAAIQFITGLMHARRVNQNDLAFRSRDDAENFEASRLRLVRNGRNLFADQSIEQRRLARIRPADEGDVAGAEILIVTTHQGWMYLDRQRDQEEFRSLREE